MAQRVHTRILWLDTETFSPVPINRGTDVYAREVEIMIAAYAIDAGAVRVWDCTDGTAMPADLYEALHDPATMIVCHNMYFDRTVIKYAWHLDLPLSRLWCTYAQALAHSLPGGLGLLCDVLAVKTRKQVGGKEHINLFCKPLPKNQKLRRATSETHPEQWAEFLSYAADDVGAMRDAYYAMPRRNYLGEEKEFWNLDQEINDTGLYIDVDFMDAAIELLEIDKRKADAKIATLTGGAVTAATQRDKFMTHLLMEHGVLLDSLKADDLEEMIAEDWLPVEVKELLKLRIMAAMNSTAKYKRLKNSIGPDNRLRGTRQFNGASRTGRSAGRIFNPLNMRRPTMKADDIEFCIGMITRRDADDIDLFADSLREACSNATRGLVIAAPGKKLVVSDWAGIEARMAAWLVGETWKLDAFRAFDTIIPGKFDKKGKPLRAGADSYKLTYHKSFGTPVDQVTDFQRQIGKGEDLSMQYGGGVGAFIAVSYSYGLDLDELGRVMPNLAPWEAVAQARAIYHWAVKKGKDLGLAEPVYVACETVKSLWRKANPNFERGWADLENAVRSALDSKGTVFHACRCAFEFKADWLMITLPSGRTLMYPTPRITADGTITYAGAKNKRWTRIKTYGGKILENITQAASRDILAASMLRINRQYGVDRWVYKTDAFGNTIGEGFNAAGVRIVLDVYDEIVCEVDKDDDFNLATMNNILTAELPWTAGLPLAAEGFEGYRYAKH